MAMGSDDFVAAVREAADLGHGYLVTRTKSRLGGERYDMATITFYNVPEDLGRGGGGAVAMNNRLQFFVEGFGRGQNEPPPTGKVKLDFGGTEVLPPGTRPRRKTATPEKMVKYVAKMISDAAKLPPKLPPGSVKTKSVAKMKAQLLQ